jgi:PKD repeat protein
VPYTTGNTAIFIFTPNDNGSYAVTLTVRNGAAIIGSDSKTITVTNVAPRAIFTGPAGVRTNANFVLSLLFASDLSSLDRNAGFSYAFDCGDGQGWRSQLSASIRCQAPATPSTITVQGRITDKDGGVSIYRGTITIRR